ncbi:hypothetical protein GGI07_005756 [Coemansia sp. Benny D115]|nr:hypothetical protein GGI07_005756 [Coemansia sp. Benny D115]
MSTATTTVTLARPHIHSLHLRSSSSLSLSPPTTPRMPENLDHRLTPELSATNSNTSTSTSTGSSVASRDSGADSQTKSRLSQTETETWPTAVEALVQRLWECGRDALNRHYSTSPPTSAAPSASGSKLVFDDTEEAGNLGLDAASSLDQHDDTAVDADSLCDGPYVRVDYCSQPESSKLAQDKIIGAVTAPASPSENAQRDVSAAKACGVNGGLDHDSLPARRQQTPHCGRKRQAATCEKKRPALLHYQPMSNPFKTMLRQPMSPQPAASATGAAAAGYAPAIQSFCSSTALSGGSVNNNNNNNNTGISTKQNALQPAIQPLNKGIRLRSSNRIVNPSTSPLATSIAAVKCVWSSDEPQRQQQGLCSLAS